MRTFSLPGSGNSYIKPNDTPPGAHRQPCAHANEARETGESDAMFDGIESPLACNCAECRAAYAAGVEAGVDQLLHP